jgi:hypothetical protein
VWEQIFRDSMWEHGKPMWEQIFRERSVAYEREDRGTEG